MPGTGTVSRSAFTTLGFLLILATAYADYITGPEIALGIFYLLPISLVAWFGNRWASVAACVLSAAAWLIVQFSSGGVYSHPFIPYWNSLIRLGFFSVVAFLLRTLRARDEDLEATIAKRTSVLTAEVAERQRAEAALRDSEQRFQSAFQHAPIGMALVGLDSTMRQVNRALCQMLGYTDEELLALPVWAVTHPDDIAVTLEGARRIASGESDTWHLEKRFVRKDGHLVSGLSSTSLVRAPDGSPLYFVSQVLDITQRLRAQQTLADEVAISHALAQAGRDVIASLGTPDFLNHLCRVTAQVLACDSSHTLLWRSNEDAFVPVAWYGVTPEEDEVARLIRVPRSVMSGVLSRLQSEDVAQVGTIPLDVLSMPEQQRLGVPLTLCMALRRGEELIGLQTAQSRGRRQPFTEVQWRIAQGVAQVASVALEHARVLEELAQANRLKSDFAATMSHELRTPLSVIIGYTDLLVEGGLGRLTPEQTESLQRVRRCSRELLDLINATLDLSRLEAGRMPVDMTEVLLPDLVDQLDGETRDLQERSGLRVVWNVAPDLPRIRTDPVKVRLVLKNLIANAMKFTEQGTVTVDVRADNDGVVIAVTDTGIGIQPEALPIIFEPFQQADNSSTRRHGGVGLGLYIVRRLLDMLGGTVTVDSALGRGSTFRVWLPTAPPPHPRRA